MAAGFRGMDPATVKDMAAAFRRADQAAGEALATLVSVKARHDGVAGGRGDRLRETLGPAIRRMEGSVRVAGDLGGQLLNEIGEQDNASGGGGRPGGSGRPIARSMTLQPSAPPAPVIAPAPPGTPLVRPPIPVPPATPGPFQVPGGPVIPSDITPGGRIPRIPPVPMEIPPVIPPVIPWALIGRLSGAGIVLGALLIPSNDTPMLDYVDPAGKKHRLDEDKYFYVLNKQPGYEELLGYPEGTFSVEALLKEDNKTGEIRLPGRENPAQEAPPAEPIVPVDEPDAEPEKVAPSGTEETRVIAPPDPSTADRVEVLPFEQLPPGEQDELVKKLIEDTNQTFPLTRANAVTVLSNGPPGTTTVTVAGRSGPGADVVFRDAHGSVLERREVKSIVGTPTSFQRRLRDGEVQIDFNGQVWFQVRQGTDVDGLIRNYQQKQPDWYLKKRERVDVIFLDETGNNLGRYNVGTRLP